MLSRTRLAMLAVPLVILVGVLPSASQDKPAQKTTAELRAKVKALVAQLADKDLDRQDEAAATLLSMGPDVLPFLPRPGEKLTDSQKKTLAVVRKTLRDDQIKRDLTPRLVTIQGEFPLSKALSQLATQSGSSVEDRREEADDLKIQLNLEKATFWEAIDTIARQADARVSVYERDFKVALRRRTDNAVTPPTHYNGIFRTQVKRVVAQRDYDTESSRYTATVEITWEPRFRPFLLEFRPRDLIVKDEKGKNRSGDEEEMVKLAITNRSFVQFDIPLPALERAEGKLGLLKGAVQLIGPTRMETFEFPATLAEMVKDPARREMTREGVTVKMSKLELTKEAWTLIVGLEYPADGPQFESFESWLVYNEILLKHKDGKGEFPNNSGYNIEDSGGNRALLSYHFTDDRKEKLLRGEPGDWTPVYKTPGLIVDVPAAFEFKNLPLP